MKCEIGTQVLELSFKFEQIRVMYRSKMFILVVFIQNSSSGCGSTEVFVITKIF